VSDASSTGSLSELRLFNFLILVWLLKHFLYKPILDAIDAREKRIASELQTPIRRRLRLEKRSAPNFEDKQSFRSQAERLLGKAADEAKAERERPYRLRPKKRIGKPCG